MPTPDNLDNDAIDVLIRRHKRCGALAVWSEARVRRDGGLSGGVRTGERWTAQQALDEWTRLAEVYAVPPGAVVAYHLWPQFEAMVARVPLDMIQRARDERLDPEWPETVSDARDELEAAYADVATLFADIAAAAIRSDYDGALELVEELPAALERGRLADSVLGREAAIHLETDAGTLAIENGHWDA